MIDKIRYTLNGIMLERVKDIFVDDYIKRVSGNKTIFIKDGEVLKVEKSIELKSLSITTKDKGFVEDYNIGVIDTETYKARDGSIKIHALGFKTVLDKDVVMFYIDKETMDHSNLILNFINEILRPKYANFRFYCHNLGGYDIVFLLKTIYLFNETKSNEQDKYNVSLILIDNRVLKCDIKKNNLSTVIIDSYPILPKKLSVLAKDFNVETLKSIFPYEFSLEDNLI